MTTRQQQRRAARLRAGFGAITEAAQRADVSVSYLRRLERDGDAPFDTARRLSRIFDCPLELFMWP